MSAITRLPSELVAAPPNRWDAVQIGLIAVILALAAAAFGGVEAWCELVLVALAATLSLLLVARTAIDRDFCFPFTWAYLPAAGWLALGALQLAPLPTNFITMLRSTPQFAETAPEAASQSITIYPWATAHSLRLAMIAVTVFVAAFSAAKTPQLIKRLLAVAFLIGCAEAALAIAQIFTGAKAFYWSIAAGSTLLTAGSFVNYSNFCQFINLAIGCGIGLLLATFQLNRGKGAAWTPSLSGNQRNDVGWMIAGVALCGLAVFTSLSRNGALSLVAASIVVGAALYRDGTLSGRGWALAAAPLAAAGALLFFGFDAVYNRLATLRGNSGAEARWDLTLATLRSWRTAPIVGKGLGTHEYAYSQFDPTPTLYLAQHADNDYAQLLEETGVVGAVLAVAFFALVARAIWNSIRHGRTPTSFAAFGLALGLMAVAIHGATDFGVRLPAVACQLAITCGLAVAIDRWERSVRNNTDSTGFALNARSMNRQRMLAVISAAALVPCWWWAIRGATAAYHGELWWAAEESISSRIARVPEDQLDQEYIDLIAAGEKSVESDPGNVKLRYRLSLDRWSAVNRYLNDETPPASLDPEARAIVTRIADELAATRTVCPTYGPPYSLEGQLRNSILGDPSGAALIARGMKLAPYDPATTFLAGELAAMKGKADEARRLLTRATVLDRNLFGDAARLMIDPLDKLDWARDLAGNDYHRLAELAAVCRESGREEASVQFEAEAEKALQRRAETDVASGSELAELARRAVQRGDKQRAVELYQQALSEQFGQVEWRLALADQLVQLGKFEAAEHEARICLQLRPKHPGAISIIERATVRKVVNPPQP